MNLYNTVNELKQQIDAIVLAHPELSDDPEFAAEVFSAETNIEGVLTKLLDFSNDAKSMACAVKARREELKLRESRFDVKHEQLRRLIQVVMERAGIPKLQLVEASLSIAHYPPSPIIIDEAMLPADCTRIKREPDLPAIKQAIKEGRAIPGVALSNGRSGLVVRTK